MGKVQKIILGLVAIYCIMALVFSRFFLALEQIAVPVFLYGVYAMIRIIFSHQRKTYLIKTVAAFAAGSILMLIGTGLEPPEYKAERAAKQEQAQQEEQVKKEQKAAEQAAQKAQEEQETAAKAEQDAKDKELQEAYDKQAQYEEWLDWQKQQQEAEEAERNKYTPVTAYQMLNDYESNGASAKSTYQGKYFKITGYVEWIAADGMSLILSGGDDFPMGAITCDRKPVTAGTSIKSLSKGQQVTISGKVKSVGEAVATNGLGNEVTGYRVEVDRID